MNVTTGDILTTEGIGVALEGERMSSENSRQTILTYLHEIMGRTCHNRQMNKWTTNSKCIFRQYILLPKMCYIFQQPSPGTGIKDATELTRQAMYVKRNNEAFRATIVAVEKQ